MPEPVFFRGFNPTMVRLLQREMRASGYFPQLFQSHNGAIAAQQPLQFFPFAVWFQSHNGAIAAWSVQTCNASRYEFQSHNGAIAAVAAVQLSRATEAVSIPQWCDCCQHQRRRNGRPVTEFQSHNGAIAAHKSKSTLFTNPSFNPTMVRLLRPLKFILRERGSCFNPTMVRLLPEEELKREAEKVKFQSHNGAIAANTP